MKSKPSSRCRQNSNAYATFNNRLSVGVRHWLRSVSNNDASVKQNDNGEHKRTQLAAWAASSRFEHATTAALASKCDETTLKSTVLVSAVFFYKTPVLVTTGIAKMDANIIYAHCVCT